VVREFLGVPARAPGPVSQSATVEVPARISSAYEVIERLGSGGMGVVYKARDRRLRRLVALKLLPDALAEEPHIRERFIHGPLPVAQAVDYASQVADGLVHAHAAAIVHRDIKPANVLVTPDGRAKILDFGIAKLADARLTRSGMVLGTFEYMSPEQAGGEPVDHRSDLWSLGVVLYEMLTGESPFRRESSRATLAAIQVAAPAPLVERRADVPPELNAVVMRLLSKEPADRLPSAAAVPQALEGIEAPGEAPLR
jgi:eukaryotic-like serine/threonine-protein kinase